MWIHIQVRSLCSEYGNWSPSLAGINKRWTSTFHLALQSTIYICTHTMVIPKHWAWHEPHITQDGDMVVWQLGGCVRGTEVTFM